VGHKSIQLFPLLHLLARSQGDVHMMDWLHCRKSIHWNQTLLHGITDNLAVLSLFRSLLTPSRPRRPTSLICPRRRNTTLKTWRKARWRVGGKHNMAVISTWLAAVTTYWSKHHPMNALGPT
jgi:hypothetical protein